MKRFIFARIWRFSEWSGVGLGKYAPYVFEQMMGLNKGIEIDSLGQPLPTPHAPKESKDD